MADYLSLPSDLPTPEDDGAADHLPGLSVPSIELLSTSGETGSLSRLPGGRTVLYIYPLTGKPGVDLPEGWDEIPGARGCTPESCGFRDLYADLQTAGASAVYGLSTQSTDYQVELSERLGLPFAILSDPELQLGAALDLPTFTAEGRRLYRRLTMIIADSRIEHVFYPVFPPDRHAEQVLEWLVGNAAPAS